jgi:hypothetical protein
MEASGGRPTALHTAVPAETEIQNRPGFDSGEPIFMPIFITPQLPTAHCGIASRALRLCRVAGSLAVLVALLAGGEGLPAQAPAKAAASATPSQPARTSHRPRTAHGNAKPAPAPIVAATPAAPAPPELPHWPVNDKPTKAAVAWDSQGLRIEANNSSLGQILKEIGTLTGAQIDGFSDDRRIFGTFGPGPTGGVISELLQGSGYNVVMVGDQGAGTPRQIVLTSRNPSQAADNASKPVKASGDDDEDAEDAAPSAPPPVRPDTAPGYAPRTPQQIMQDMHRRSQPPQNGNPQN